MDEELEDTRAESESEFYDGFNQGYLTGFDAGISIGRDQGYQDCLYRIKRMAADVYDPELEKAIETLTGDD